MKNMKKFIKNIKITKAQAKDIAIEAIQWNGENLSELSAFVKTARDITLPDKSDKILIPTKKGDFMASVGDYVLKAKDGTIHGFNKEKFDDSFKPMNKKKRLFIGKNFDLD